MHIINTQMAAKCAIFRTLCFGKSQEKEGWQLLQNKCPSIIDEIGDVIVLFSYNNSVKSE